MEGVRQNTKCDIPTSESAQTKVVCNLPVLDWGDCPKLAELAADQRASAYPWSWEMLTELSPAQVVLTAGFNFHWQMAENKYWWSYQLRQHLGGDAVEFSGGPGARLYFCWSSRWKYKVTTEGMCDWWKDRWSCKCWEQGCQWLILWSTGVTQTKCILMHPNITLYLSKQGGVLCLGRQQLWKNKK